MKNIFKKITPAWWFLFAMILVYFILFLFAGNLFVRSGHLLFKMLIKILPILILVFLFIYLINRYLKPEKVKKYLGKNAGIKGTLLALAAGVISTGSIYMWYPLLAELRRQGMSNRLMAIFLYNRAIKIPLFPMLILYFGLKYSIILTALMILFSLIIGWVVEKLAPVETGEDVIPR